MLKTSQSVAVSSTVGNFNKDGTLASVTVNYNLTNTKVIEVTNESGELVEMKIESIASKESITFDGLSGSSQSNIAGESLHIPSTMTDVEGGNDAVTNVRGFKMNGGMTFATDNESKTEASSLREESFSSLKERASEYVRDNRTGIGLMKNFVEYRRIQS